MRGHVRERGKGNWYAVLDVRDPATGKRKRKWHSLEAKGKREAQIECARLIHELKSGKYTEAVKDTFAHFLDRWLGEVRTRVTPKTHERYTQIAHKNVVPFLGAIPIVKLKPEQISAAYAAALTSGRRSG